MPSVGATRPGLGGGDATLTTHLGDAHVQPASPGATTGEFAPVCLAVLSSVLLGMLLVDLWPGLGRLPQPPPALAQTRGPCRVPVNVSRNVLDATGVLCDGVCSASVIPQGWLRGLDQPVVHNTEGTVLCLIPRLVSVRGAPEPSSSRWPLPLGSLLLLSLPRKQPRQTTPALPLAGWPRSTPPPRRSIRKSPQPSTTLLLDVPSLQRPCVPPTPLSTPPALGVLKPMPCGSRWTVWWLPRLVVPEPRDCPRT